jgi:hypothetical protein
MTTSSIFLFPSFCCLVLASSFRSNLSRIQIQISPHRPRHRSRFPHDDLHSLSLFQQLLDVPHGNQCRGTRRKHDDILLHRSLLLDPPRGVPLPLVGLVVRFHRFTLFSPIDGFSERLYPFFVDVASEGGKVGLLARGDVSERVVDVDMGFLSEGLELSENVGGNFKVELSGRLPEWR